MKPTPQNILIIGATGLVGSEILKLALERADVQSIKIFVRKMTGNKHPKLQEYLVKFDHISQWKSELRGDILFSALGTTLKQAGSRKAQRTVDYDYQWQVAQEAYHQGVRNYALISAPMANPNSLFAYTKMKGDLEREVIKLGFSKLTIVRPGLLTGERKEKRWGEENLAQVLKGLPTLKGFESLKPVSGSVVAKATLECALDNIQGTRILNPAEVLSYQLN